MKDRFDYQKQISLDGTREHSLEDEGISEADYIPQKF